MWMGQGWEAVAVVMPQLCRLQVLLVMKLEGLKL
jgi:hypothetical protein